jgi:glycosyltransferase involved in cell wall biosynthesis
MRTRVVIMANNIDEVGGAQRVVHVVAQGLAERGYPVDLVGIAPFEPRHEFVVVPAFRRVVLMSQAWPSPPSGSGLRARLSSANRQRRSVRQQLHDEAVRRLGAHLADGPPGVVVTSQLWAMEHLAEVPHDEWGVIGQYHSSFEAAAAGRDLPRARALYRDVDAFTLLTSTDAESFRREGLDNTSWLANPLAFWPSAPTTTSNEDAGVVTYLGRLSTEKGVGFLVDAWGRIADRHPLWRLRLVGSGPDERSLRVAVAALPAGAERIEFVPPVRDAESELRAADLLVLPSLTEGLPLVLAEGMAVGLPCIATDCSAGVRLLTADGTAARLVGRGDAGDLARGLSELMSSPSARAALGVRARAEMEQYRAETILDQWESLIATVLR